MASSGRRKLFETLNRARVELEEEKKAEQDRSDTASVVSNASATVSLWICIKKWKYDLNIYQILF